MKREDLYLAIRRATEIIEQDEILIIGSQSILGSYDETELPSRATLSDEVDMAPIRDSQDIVSDMLSAHLGQASEFYDQHGFYIDGVGKETAVLPGGWEKRLVRVDPPGSENSIGWCLDPHDLCVAKLAAAREKDYAFIVSLIECGYIDPVLLRNRVANTPVSREKRAAMRSWAEYAMKKFPRAKTERCAQGHLPKGAPKSTGGQFKFGSRAEPDIEPLR